MFRVYFIKKYNWGWGGRLMERDSREVIGNQLILNSPHLLFQSLHIYIFMKSMFKNFQQAINFLCGFLDLFQNLKVVGWLWE